MGKPCPQPRSTTAAPRGSALAQSRTLFTPIVVDRTLINSAAKPSYPFDRSIMQSPYQIERAIRAAACRLKSAALARVSRSTALGVAANQAIKVLRAFIVVGR